MSACPQPVVTVGYFRSYDVDLMSISIRVIGRELSHSSSANLYLLSWVVFASNAVSTKLSHLVDLGILDVNASDEFNIFGNPATRIRRPKYGSYWSMPDHVFGKATAVGMSTTSS